MREFGGAGGRGVVIQYHDAQELGHTCLVYVLVAEKSAVSCVVEYLDRYSEGLLPVLKKTLESFRAADQVPIPKPSPLARAPRSGRGEKGRG